MPENQASDSDLGKKNLSQVRKIYLSDSTKEKTFQYDEALPPLPVPELQQTIDKYLKSIEPFVSPERYEKTKTIAKNFENGIGKDLQRKLKERASEHKNWLADWWLKYAYLVNRDPIAPFGNMAGPHSLHLSIWKQDSDAALKRTAMFMWSVLDFYSYLREEKVRPQASRRGIRMTMHQFRHLFNSVRVPREGEDEIKSYFKIKAEGKCPDHIIVMCFGHIWVLDPWHSPGECLTVAELEEQFKYIKRISESLGEGQCVGVLTFDNREMWAKNRKWLRSLSPRNAENLRLIESAISLCCLDENAPQNLTEVSKMTLCGDPRNRWADKSNTTVSYANGYHATSNDHSPFDAMVVVTLGHYQNDIIADELIHDPSEQKVLRKMRMPRRLVFHLDDLLLSSIQRVRSLNQSLRDKIGVKFIEFGIFGKDWIQLNKIQPDAFIQCSLQLAYYQLHKRFAPTYETATTRQFYHGRTETVRSCTEEMTDFVKAMTSETATPNEKRGKLLRALKRHVQLVRECQEGQGIDRHLLGLSLIAAESGMPTPELFTDPSFSMSGGNGNFVLSTSTLGYTPVIGGVTPMVKDGYGVFYVMLPNRLYFYMTSFLDGDTCLEKFHESLTKALIYMYELVSDVQSRL